jgi:DNA mismatch repair ATPase MutS
VRRAVVRLVTPGTLTEDTLLDARRNNWLLAISRVKSSEEETSFGLAWLDISTGEFRVAESDPKCGFPRRSHASSREKSCSPIRFTMIPS